MIPEQVWDAEDIPELAQALLNRKMCSQAVTNERDHRYYIDKEAGREA
jgi:hypothetical protein